MISLKLQTPSRASARRREREAARLLFLLARTAHGRAALCHEEGANLPDALAAAVEAGGAVRGPETEETEEAETEAFSEEAADAEQKRHSPKTRRATREKKIAARVAATCARLLGSLESSRAHDPAFETVAIAADAARLRAATGMYELFFRAPPEVPAAARAAAGEALAKLVAADARAAEACVASGALAAIAAALPAADRLERDGTSRPRGRRLREHSVRGGVRRRTPAQTRDVRLAKRVRPRFRRLFRRRGGGDAAA